MPFCSDFRPSVKSGQVLLCVYDCASFEHISSFSGRARHQRLLMPLDLTELAVFTGPLWSMQCGCHACVDTRLSLHCAPPPQDRSYWLKVRKGRRGFAGDYLPGRPFIISKKHIDSFCGVIVHLNVLPGALWDFDKVLVEPPGSINRREIHARN